LTPLPPSADGRSTPPAAYPAFVVLLVEDEPLLLRSSQRMLEARGFEVATAEDALAAREASQRMPRLDLLVTDISLPGADGIDLVLELRVARPGLRVLFMSGLQATRRSIPLPDDGTWAFLAKPFASRDFDDRLAALLGPGVPPGPARRG
jgi:DNA-binding response OmpR family regulator